MSGDRAPPLPWGTVRVSTRAGD
eukprot:COSAG06_NODE_49834_length_322_cov_8.273543_1_plen_22_part_01